MLDCTKATATRLPGVNQLEVKPVGDPFKETGEPRIRPRSRSTRSASAFKRRVSLRFVYRSPVIDRYWRCFLIVYCLCSWGAVTAQSYEASLRFSSGAALLIKAQFEATIPATSEITVGLRLGLQNSLTDGTFALRGAAFVTYRRLMISLEQWYLTGYIRANLYANISYPEALNPPTRL